jgi:transposase
MTKSRLWAGLDVGAKTTSVCVINCSGEVVHEGVCPSSSKEVRHELTVFRKDRYAAVSLEAGTGTHLARALRTFGYPVILYETRQLAKFLRVRRNKTDAGDAKGVAEASRIGASVVSKVHVKDLRCQSLQSKLAIRRHLIGQRVATVNLIAHQIELFGGQLHLNGKTNELRRAVEMEMKNVFKGEPRTLIDEMRYLVDHCERLRAHEQSFNRDLRALAFESEACRRFMEIPGVGPITALAFYAAVGEPNRFVRTSRVGSYFGLTPRIHQSGLTSRSGRISRMGNTSVRSLLVQAAISFLQYCKVECDLRSWALSIEARRGKGKARVALARKLAIVMLAIWKAGSHYEHNHQPA